MLLMQVESPQCQESVLLPRLDEQVNWWKIILSVPETNREVTSKQTWYKEPCWSLSTLSGVEYLEPLGIQRCEPEIYLAIIPKTLAAL